MRLNISCRMMFPVALLMVAVLACQNTNSDQSTIEEPIILHSMDEVKEFVRQNLEKKIPEDYKIPKYITSGLELDEVYATLEKRYPNFYGLDGETYLKAIWNNPQRYLQLSLESKSLRRYYDPNSKY